MLLLLLACTPNDKVGAPADSALPVDDTASDTDTGPAAPVVAILAPAEGTTWFLHTRYDIVVTNPERRCRGIAEAELDGASVDARAIPLVDDGGTHDVRVVLGVPRPPQI